MSHFLLKNLNINLNYDSYLGKKVNSDGEIEIFDEEKQTPK